MIICDFLDWLNRGAEPETNGVVLRNVSLTLAALVGTLIGLPLAGYRSWIANKQLRLMERGQRDERFQKAADMIGSQTLSTRLGGIFALERLSTEFPEEYHVQVMKQLCAFSRCHGNELTGDGKVLQNSDFFAVVSEFAAKRVETAEFNEQANDQPSAVFPDVEAATRVIGSRGSVQKGIEENAKGFQIDLCGAILNNASLWNCNLSNTQLMKANLRNAKLLGANFSNATVSGAIFHSAILPSADFTEAIADSACFEHAMLSGANFTNAQLWRANLNGASISGAKLTNTALGDASFKNTKGLTQKMLDEALPAASPTPFLHDGICAETGEKLVWKHVVKK